LFVPKNARELLDSVRAAVLDVAREEISAPN